MTPSEIDFQPYLRSLITTYEKWWQYYTLTDATGRVQEPEAECPSPFDFGLVVQTVAKEKDGADPGADLRQEKREKTERLPVLEGICKYADQHVLLVGRPGSGKSTALIRLLLEMAALTPSPFLARRGEPEQIPVLVELRYWESSILERMRAFLGRHDPGLNLDDATLTALLRQGRFLLLMDGLNELPSEDARTQLAAFRRDYAKVSMIFTTRDLGLGGDLGIEKKLEMQPLTEAQMKAFIRAYVPEQAEVMLRQLSDRLREFGQTPLLLWMLCEVFQQSPNHQMPSNLAGVFQTFTGMYEASSVRKHEVALLKGDVRPLSDRRLWKPALQALAAVMLQGETLVDFRVAIHRQEAERELSRIFPNERFPVRDVLDDLLKYHLLQNRSADQLEFRHQLIQEYYAAEYLLRLLPELSDEELKRDYLNYLKWTEPVALMLALVDEEAQALRVVKLAMDDVDLMLGARLAGDVQLKFQDKAIALILEKKFVETIKVTLLGSIRSKLAAKKLIDFLRSYDNRTRSRAALMLGRNGDTFSVDALVSTLTTNQPLGAYEKNQVFYRRVVNALEKIGGELAENKLIELLEHRSILIRKIAAKSIGKLGCCKALPMLLKSLSDEDQFVRQEVAIALGKVVDSTAIPSLLKALKDEDAVVRKQICKALGDLDLDERSFHELTRITLEDKSKTVRKSARATLNKRFQKIDKSLTSCSDVSQKREHQKIEVKEIGLRSVPDLLHTLQNSKVSKERKKAVIELGKIRTSEASQALLYALHDSEASVRQHAAFEIARIGSSTNISSQIPQLLDICLTGRAELFYTIQNIQNIQDGCRFYNYEIWQEAIEVQNSKSKNQINHNGGNTQINLQIDRLQIDQNFSGDGNIVTGNVEGHQNILPHHSIN